MSKENRALQRPLTVSRGLTKIAPLSLCVVAVLAFTASLIYGAVINNFKFGRDCPSAFEPPGSPPLRECEDGQFCCRTIFQNEQTFEVLEFATCCSPPADSCGATLEPDDFGNFFPLCLITAGEGDDPKNCLQVECPEDPPQ